jgi:hypothetical protein
MAALSDPSNKRRPSGLWSGWLGPVRLPDSVGRRMLDSAHDLGDRIKPWPWWVALGLLLGTVPLLFDYALGLSSNRLVTSMLLTPLLLAAVARDWQGRGLVLLLLTFASHNILTIVLAFQDPLGLGPVCPGGAGYWEKSRTWILTGVSEEYDLGWWLPAHFQWLGVMIGFTYTSFGMIPVWRGLYEVDVMNFYVGQLLAHSNAPAVTLVLGWHPWSLCRGIGYLFLTFEVASLSLARLTGVSLSSWRRRLGRWLIGLSFLLLDGLLKYFCLESVRQVLAGHLG